MTPPIERLWSQPNDAQQYSTSAPMSATQYEHIADLIATHRARLHQLQLKQALLGMATPEHIPLEIDQIADAIERLSGQPVEMTVREAYLVDQQYKMRIEGDIFKLDRKLDRLAGRVEDLFAALALHALALTPQHSNGGD
jgi:hypothetical protein